jgi:hypothetical protein
VAGPAIPAGPAAADTGARADSLRADSVAAAARDAARQDSAARADSVARADSLRKVAEAPPPPAPKATGRAPKTRECILDFSESPPESRLTYLRFPDGSANTYIGGGFQGRCQGETSTIRADSAEHFQLAGVMNLFGTVVYDDPGKVRVQSDRATYFTRDERLYAEGNVVGTQLQSGSTFTGPVLEYFREIPGARPFSRMVAPSRPTVRMVERDSLGREQPPVYLQANTIEDVADSLLYGWGNVTIDRSTLHAESDSAAFDKGRSRARLIRSAFIVSRDTAQPFRLSGDTIDLFTASDQRTLERVLAIHRGYGTSRDVVLQAEFIDMRLVDQKVDRAFAYGPARATARTPGQDLEADSIAIRMPEQRVREIRAFGRAVATGIPDSTRIRSEERDVLRGDTVVAHFDSLAAPGDTTGRVEVREIRATGNASSLFQIPSSRGPEFPPALNYVRGRDILVVFDSGAVRDVTVDSSAFGVYLEPVPDSLGDSTAAGTRPPARAGAPRPPAAGGAPVPPAQDRPGAPTSAAVPASAVTASLRRRP